eukprot:gene6939-12556_t
MVNASMFFAIFSVFQLSVICSNLVSKGSYFIELGDAQDEGSDLSLGTTVFSENFHKCSLVESCKYLSLDMNTKKYTQISNEDEIPKNRTGFKIWKKVSPEGSTYRSCKDAYNAGNLGSGVIKIRLPGGRETEYTIHIDGYAGDIGDSMETGYKFSTWDNDNDNASRVNCAATRGGPWWHNSCGTSRLMNLFFLENGSRHEKMKWKSLGEFSHKITFAEMKLRE